MERKTSDRRGSVMDKEIQIKPIFLTGEVKAFEHIQQELWRAFNENGVRDFYLQEFEPKMITTYFKKWIVVEEGHMLTSIKTRTLIACDDPGTLVWIYSLAGCPNTYSIQGKLIDHTFPETLQHFISDMGRCGLTLEWKD